MFSSYKPAPVVTAIPVTASPSTPVQASGVRPGGGSGQVSSNALPTNYTTGSQPAAANRGTSQTVSGSSSPQPVKAIPAPQLSEKDRRVEALASTIRKGFREVKANTTMSGGIIALIKDQFLSIDKDNK